MRWYVPVDPPEDLAGVLACSWTAQPTGEHRLVPDGCIDIVWASSGGLILCGPEDRAWTFELPPATTAVGIRFRPGAAPALLGFDASSIYDHRVSLGDVIGRDRELTLLNQVKACDTADERRSTLEHFVSSIVRERGIDLTFTDTLVDRLVTSPPPTASDLADLVGLTTRQLRRRALRSFGYGPKVLERLLRFQRFLALEHLGADGTTLTELAAMAGYSDHPHLARDCAAITGLSPSRFLNEYFTTFPDMSDPFKTASSLTATMLT